MIRKSKLNDVYIEQSQVNASWDVFAERPSTAVWTRTQSPTTGQKMASPCSLQLLNWTRSNHNEKVTAKLPSSDSTAPAISTPSKRKRLSNLIEPEALHRLLRQLRSDEFAGTIDMEYHSQYIEPPLPEARLKVPSTIYTTSASRPGTNTY